MTGEDGREKVTGSAIPLGDAGQERGRLVSPAGKGLLSFFL